MFKDRPQPRIPIDGAKLAALCQRWHIARLSLFGSVLRDDFRPDSDVDVLIQFEPGHTPGWEIVDLGEELSALFGGHYVDIVNPRYLDQRIRESVLRSALLQYEAAHDDDDTRLVWPLQTAASPPRPVPTRRRSS